MVESRKLEVHGRYRWDGVRRSVGGREEWEMQVAIGSRLNKNLWRSS